MQGWCEEKVCKLDAKGECQIVDELKRYYLHDDCHGVKPARTCEKLPAKTKTSSFRTHIFN